MPVPGASWPGPPPTGARLPGVRGPPAGHLTGVTATNPAASWVVMLHTASRWWRCAGEQGCRGGGGGGGGGLGEEVASWADKRSQKQVCLNNDTKQQRGHQLFVPHPVVGDQVGHLWGRPHHLLLRVPPALGSAAAAGLAARRRRLDLRKRQRAGGYRLTGGQCGLASKHEPSRADMQRLQVNAPDTMPQRGTCSQPTCWMASRGCTRMQGPCAGAPCMQATRDGGGAGGLGCSAACMTAAALMPPKRCHQSHRRMCTARRVSWPASPAISWPALHAQ